MKKAKPSRRTFPWERLAAGGRFDIEGDERSRRAALTAGQGWCRRHRPDLRCVTATLPSGRIRVRLVPCLG